MNPHSLLIVFEVPTEAGPDLSQWHTLSQTIDNAKRKNGQIESLAPNALLIALQNGLQIASDVMAMAGHHRVHYRAMFLQEKPEWIQSFSKDSASSGGLF